MYNNHLFVIWYQINYTTKMIFTVTWRESFLMIKIYIYNNLLLGNYSYLIIILLYFDPRPSPKMLFQGDTPEGSDTFQWPVIERDRVGGLRLMIWDKMKVPLCHYSDAPEESNLWTAWQLFPLDDD